jgi:hypothetical protein
LAWQRLTASFAVPDAVGGTAPSPAAASPAIGG